MAPHIGSILRMQAAQAEDVALTYCEGRERSGPELEARICALRTGLEDEIGIDSGDRVALLASNTDHFMEALLAAAAAGAITAPINHRWSTKEAIASVTSLNPKLLMVDHSCAELGRQIAASIPELRAVIWLGDEPHSYATPCHHRCLMAESIISRESRRFRSSRTRHQDLKQAPGGVALICFTSGTSGRSKGAMITHTALLGQAMAKVIMAGYSSQDTYLHTAPLFHIGGLSYAIALMSVGARHVFLPRFSVAGMVEALQQHEVTATILVPALLVQILSGTGSEELRWAAMRSIVMGAGRATEEELQLCQRLFPQASIHCAYGMTEAASTMTWRLICSPSSPIASEDSAQEGVPPSASNCVGRPSPFTEVAVMINGRREAVVGAEGEVWVRGFHTMLAYWGLAKETAAAMTPSGWLRTGDIGCMDKQGRLWLTGRLKDVIRSGSENVHAAEVEAAILAHPGVSAAAAVGLPDAALGELVACLLKLEPGWEWETETSPEVSSSDAKVGEGRKDVHQQQQELSLGVLQQHCAEMGLSRYKIPRFAIGLSNDLPCNAVGKVLKHEVRDKLAQQKRADASRTDAASDDMPKRIHPIHAKL